jgi:hypothetical protein
MATTTNYSWTTPDDTALVKDGASAIRTLGSSVDTTVKALNPETTLGDLAYRSSTANVKTRLGLGTANQVLTVNSGATAPEWKTPTSGGMTSIASGTLSGASVSLTSIPATYNDLVLVIRNYDPSADQSAIYLNFNSDTGANRYLDTTTLSGTSAYNATRLLIGESGQDDTVNQGFTIIEIPDYKNTTTWKHINYTYYGNMYNASTQVNFSERLGFYNQVAAISSIQLTTVSQASGVAGTFSGGTYILYGVQ